MCNKSSVTQPRLQVGVKARHLGYSTTMPPEISTALCVIAIRCILRWSTPLWCGCWPTPTQIYPWLISLQVHLYECDYCRPYVQWCCCWWGWLCGRQCDIEFALGGRERRHANWGLIIITNLSFLNWAHYLAFLCRLIGAQQYHWLCKCLSVYLSAPLLLTHWLDWWNSQLTKCWSPLHCWMRWQ